MWTAPCFDRAMSTVYVTLQCVGLNTARRLQVFISLVRYQMTTH